MYRYIKNIDSFKYIPLIDKAKWKEVKSSDRLFYTCMLDLEGFNCSFLLKIPPGGNVHKHIDTARPDKTYHLPLMTNGSCFNYTYNPESKTHLEVGKLYEINRQIKHDSWNFGKTDRIHLILECCDLPI